MKDFDKPLPPAEKDHPVYKDKSARTKILKPIKENK